MTKPKYRYIKRGEVIPRDAEWQPNGKGKWEPYFLYTYIPSCYKVKNNTHKYRTIRVEVKPRKKP